MKQFECMYEKCIQKHVKLNDVVRSQDIILYLKQMGYKRVPMPKLIGRYLRTDNRFKFDGIKGVMKKRNMRSVFYRRVK